MPTIRRFLLPALAAVLAYGISRNHPFVDGNKRVSLVASFVFLEINGHRMTAALDEVYETFLAVAAGRLTQDDLIQWFDLHAERL